MRLNPFYKILAPIGIIEFFRYDYAIIHQAVLIPTFGVQTIVVGCAIALLLLGATGLYVTKSLSKKLFLVLFFSLLFSFSINSITGLQIPSVVHIEDGVYERLVVYDTVYRGRPARMLLQDLSSASAIDRETGKLVFEYAQYSQLHKLLENPKEMLIIGAGTYTMPKVLLEETQDATIDVVEIEPKLYEIARKYYDLPDSERMNNHIADGRRFLHDSPKKYDFLFFDAYASIYSVPSHLVTQEFFELTKSKMNTDALLVVNIIGSLTSEDESLSLSFLKTFKDVFPNTYVFAAQDPHSNATQNLLFVAYNSEKMLDLETTKIVDYATQVPINLKEQQVDTSQFHLQKHVLFTDNYVPAEIYGIKLLNRINERTYFDGDRAYQRIKKQLDFGPRHPGTDGYKKLQEYIQQESEILGLEVVKQPFAYKSSKGTFDLQNIIVRLDPANNNRLILGAHYDTKRYADLDSRNKRSPVPGANDAGSGVAVLLELMRVIKENNLNIGYGIDFVFFDGEEAEDLKDGVWEPLGSTYFAKNIDTIYQDQKPKEAIVVDMVCKKGLQIHKEANSDRLAKDLNRRFFEVATKKYPNTFSNSVKHVIGDDHMPLNQIGIPSIVLIDFDYPYWHTTEDTLDKCSPESLESVGESVLQYILGK